jgi:hypothetical protein
VIKRNIKDIKNFDKDVTDPKFIKEESRILWNFMNNIKEYFILMRTNMIFLYPFYQNNTYSSQYKPYFYKYSKDDTKIHMYQHYKRHFFKEGLKPMQQRFIDDAQLYLHLEKR